MIFSHDTEQALLSIVELVNSSPERNGKEQLPDVATLDEFVARHRVSEIAGLTERDVHDVHSLRERIYPIFTATSDAEAATFINAIIATTPVTPRLTDHDGYPLHMHYFIPGATLAEHLAADCGIALAQVVAAGEQERLRSCEAPDCSEVLVDLSRNRCKRYCDARTCGNRLHVAAYRERRRAAAAS
ncbi:MAG: hypothetical protein GEU93_20290 [Propionibacteriales bacterium]|nr:hypothetical protein [Propionibacteriales bacterium]